jgi:ATP-dependent helicase HrpB
VLDLEAEIVAGLRASRRLVLTAPTGSGKSTQVPRMLRRHGFLGDGLAIVLQPRRIAARMLAARVAKEEGTALGHEVGYQVRFEGEHGAATRILFVTEGILLRRMVSDPLLRGVSALVFDEFHERHLYSDATLAWALELQEKRRPDLAIVAMSATLDASRLESYLKPCARVSSEGRMFPVRVDHVSETSEPWEGAADAVALWAREGGEGDALVFMPGAWEIARTLDALRARPELRDRLLLPLHGELPPSDQDAAVTPGGRPKVVVATNVAETSLTIEGVRLVVDSGLARLPRHDPWRGVNSLTVEKISRASADQRAGRAGRTAPGRCVRLWGEADHAKRPAREEPEVRRVELSEAVLTLLAAGVADLRTFRWLDPPEEKALAHAEALLADLGAVSDGTVTALGRRMLGFPVHPRYARMMLAAESAGCVREAALLAALTQGRDLLVRGPDALAAEFREAALGSRAESDFLMIRRAWEFARESGFRADACRRAGIHAHAARQVAPAFEQFLRAAAGEGLDVSPRPAGDEALCRCILAGFSDRVARRAGAGTLDCEVVHARKGVLVRESAVRHATLFVAGEIREVEGRRKSTLLSLATSIEPEWLREMFPADISLGVRATWDAESRRVVAEEVEKFRDLAVGRRAVDPSPDEAARILAAEVLAGRVPLDDWDASVDQWILRVNFLSRSCPELGLAPIGEKEKRRIVERVCSGALSARDVKNRPVKSLVREGRDVAAVEKHAPERLELANGRTPKLTYRPDKGPFLSARIQELFGIDRLPGIAMGRVAPLVHVLAPSSRPVQITADLASFWRDHYPRIKRELQRKYPKHEWR